MKQYLRLLAKYPAFLTFGFLATFASSFGQTFFIGLFNDALRESHNLSYGDFGALYAAATFVGGVLLMRIGKKLDVVPLSAFTCFTFGGLILSAVLIAVDWHVALLFVALAGLRLFGQGFMGHIAMTSMGRYFSSDRGKAIAIAGMGFPLGEMILPILVVMLFAAIGWKSTWLVFAGLLLLMLPLMISLQRDKPDQAEQTHGVHKDELATLIRQRDIVRERTFWMVLPAMLGLPFLVTALLLNQLWLAQENDWPVAAVASGILMFSVSRVSVSLIAGSLIDRIGSVRLIGANILPATLGAALLLIVPGFWAWWLFLALAGVSAGINSALSGTLWAELYGVTRLATVRALVHALMVFATALSPLLMGLMIDTGLSSSAVISSFILLLLLAWVNAQRLNHKD
ncbi:MFS transporter [Pseudidiomarina sp.]|uniref:MFS transporter n=1 Tax=Pseudidiomarina sp. TaxID=2081707 RepID=UPI00299F3848|nr:MFS transporter [Pseudidiomarina sp.]MDX1706502.1 MFS transporter [Pseudidiomarina sp.]